MGAIEAAVLAAALSVAPCSHPAITSEYHVYIEAAVQRHWPAHSRPFKCMFVAQLYAESRFDPKALSPVGARGLAQIMPATWKEMTDRLGLSCSPWDARCSIEVGAAYMGRMLRIFSAERTELDRMCWGQSSFNAGPGNALRAQRIGQTENCDEALEVWHKVTGPDHAAETRGYVRTIRKWTIRLLRGRTYPL